VERREPDRVSHCLGEPVACGASSKGVNQNRTESEPSKGTKQQGQRFAMLVLMDTTNAQARAARPGE
jgi:hypothetical protein